MNYKSISGHRGLRDAADTFNNNLKEHRRGLRKIIREKTGAENIKCQVRQVNTLLGRLKNLRKAYYVFKKTVDVEIPDYTIRRIPFLPETNHWDNIKLKFDPRRAGDDFDVGFSSEMFEKMIKSTGKFLQNIKYKVFCGKNHLFRFLCNLDGLILKFCEKILEYQNSAKILTIPDYLKTFLQEQEWKKPSWTAWFEHHEIFTKSKTQDRATWGQAGKELEASIRRSMAMEPITID